MKIQTKIVHEVEERDFNEAVSEFYGGLPYSAALALESGNDSVHSVEVDGSELDDWEADELRQWRESGMEGNSPKPDIVLAGMVRAGGIPAGEYLINVCW